MFIVEALAFLFILSQEAKEPATLLTQAAELIQKNEKQKALKLLQKAFDKSTDPEELKDIAVLLLEATPEKDAKRENYLKYLIKFNPEHEDSYKWYKEMGDRAFEKRHIEEAEDWYLRAAITASDKTLIQYKLAFVQWNLKRPTEAIKSFVEVYHTAEPGLQSQIQKDLPKIWAEAGALPASIFDQLTSFPEEDLAEIFKNLIDQLKKMPSFNSQAEAILNQTKESSSLKNATLDFLSNDSNFVRQPCLPFQKLLTFEDSYSEKLFLRCLKEHNRPPADRMLVFASKLSEATDENIVWAYAELLFQAGKLEEAAQHLWRHKNFQGRSKRFLEYVENITLQLNEEQTKALLTHMTPETFEKFLLIRPSEPLIERLQEIDSDYWIAFEERLPGIKDSKAFLLKKGAWLARKPDPSPEEFKIIFEKLIKPPTSGNAKIVADTYKSLVARSKTKLPPTFSRFFKVEFEKWLTHLDNTMLDVENFTEPWYAISKPVFKAEVQNNIRELIKQLDATTLDPELFELAETFEQKKSEMKSDLENKYLSENKE